MELCQCVSLIQCANVCESPLLKDPINGCECITLSEYLALYDHGLDENCKPIDDECADCQRNTNIFNFYAPVYGNISGFADGSVSNVNAECDEDNTDDIGANETEDNTDDIDANETEDSEEEDDMNGG